MASDNGIVIAASYWGKIQKLVFSDGDGIIVSLLQILGGVFDLIGEILIWAAVALTIISLNRLRVEKIKQVLTQGGM